MSWQKIIERVMETGETHRINDGDISDRDITNMYVCAIQARKKMKLYHKIGIHIDRVDNVKHFIIEKKAPVYGHILAI